MKLIYILAFVLFYLWEIALSTFRIGCMVLRPKLSLQSRFVDVPLALEGDLPRFLFACLISMTPGSLSVALDSERNILVVHLIDAPDEEAAIRELKDLFESPLIRIFGSKNPSNT
jgi:multicomponent K+:H+ antiporter subunit E